MKFKLIFCFTLLFVSLCLAEDSSSEEKDMPKPKEKEESENVKQSNDVVPPVPGQQQQQQQQQIPLNGDKAGLIKVDLGFIHAFVASLSVIIVSELGDKTFFIAAIMAMRHSRLVVFAGAISALFIMTLLSALLGYATTVIPRWLTYYVSSALFAIFGLRMIREGMKMSADEGQEEYEEVQADIRKKDEEYDGQGEKDVETGVIRTPQRRLLYMFFSRVFIQSLTLTFLAEWGDRSQLATIILAAREEVIGVVLGGTIGHALCTGLAVMGGRFIAQRISIRTVTLIGGVVFLLFALSAFVIHPDD